MSQSHIPTPSPTRSPNLKIKIIGKPFTSTLQPNPQPPQPHNPTDNNPSQTPTPPYTYPQLPLPPQSTIFCPELDPKPYPYIPAPKKIHIEANLIAIIDMLDNLWFVSDLFPQVLNVSAMIGRKVRAVFLSEGECIVSCVGRRSLVLVNWGAKKILDVSGMEAVKFNEKAARSVASFFTAYIMNSCHKDDKFYYTSMKKIDNSNKLYHLKLQTPQPEPSQSKSQKRTPSRTKTTIKHTMHTSPTDPSAPTGSTETTYSIVAFPTYQTLKMRHRVVGISAGKFHCMCWDEKGLLYTWGCRSIALGYEELPHEKITTRPRLVRSLDKFITMGFAATHYSLALSSDGNLYEWGIKQQPNKLNQQLIFTPKPLPIPQTNPNQSPPPKILLLKGKQSTIAALDSSHQLHIWGPKAAKYLPAHVQTQMKFCNGHIYEPFLVPYLEREHIVDFDIGDDCVVVICCDGPGVMGEEERGYWEGMLRRVRGKLKLGNTVKTENVEVCGGREVVEGNFRNSESEVENAMQLQFGINGGQFQTNVQKSYRQRSLKKYYFKQLRNQDTFYINLLKNNKNYQINTNQLPQPSNQNKSKQKKNKKILSQRFDKQNLRKSLDDNETKVHALQTESNIKKSSSTEKGESNMPSLFKKDLSLFNNSQINQKSINQNTKYIQTIRESYQKGRSLCSRKGSMKISKLSQFKRIQFQSYQQRLKKVKDKKQNIQRSFNHKISKRLEESSVQFRKFRHQKIVQQKIHQKNRNILKHTLQSFLIKHYLIRMITSPIQQARRVKIEQFAKSLHLSRIQKNLRKIFIKARINHGLKKLRKLNFQRFALLCCTFHKFVKKRRQQKAHNMKKIIAQQLFKYVLKQKIRFGLSKSHLNTRKLQKFRQWLVLTKIQRIRCLKVLWKNHLLSIMKTTNQLQSISLLKSQQNCTFESLYKQKIALNPMLKLQTFLNKSPIFELRYQYFQSIIFLFRKDNKVKSQKILKSIKSARRKQRIKFSGEGQVISLNSCFHNASDLLPYSLHYNLLIRPKSMQINIPQNMKKNQRWIQQQRNIFQKCLKQILQSHQKSFRKAKNKYDIDLAYYIRQKYDILAQKRWKCIIQFNKIKSTPYKKKREKQLYRIFDLIGMEKVLNQDCLPEKYLMLDEAAKKREAPPSPNSFIVFGVNQFKEIFKRYYEIISVRAKHLRKNFI